MKKFHVLLAEVLLLVLLFIIGCSGEQSMPRITARNGQFINTSTGNPFTPRGFQYIRLLPSRVHYVLTPGLYDPQAVEHAFADLRQNGFNIVRIFLGQEGIFDESGLCEEHTANLIDFLEKARRHNIYVIVLQMHLPDTSERYRVKNRCCGHDNTRYFSQEHIDKKCLLLTDLVTAVKEHDPSLLSTVFAWELENESTIHIDQEPFVSLPSSFTAPNGKTYDLSRQTQLQKLLDDSTIYWANQCIQAVKNVDPQAMVTTSVFTYKAVGRTGPGKITLEESPDPRCPLRPLALAKSNLSYLDIHFYVNSIEHLKQDFECIELDDVKTICNQTGKPLFVGEVGAIKPLFPKFEQAVEQMPKIIEHLEQSGFAGWSFWTYDCHEQPECWNAKHNKGELYQLLIDLKKTK